MLQEINIMGIKVLAYYYAKAVLLNLNSTFKNCCKPPNDGL